MKCKKCGFEWKSYGETIHCPSCSASALLTHSEQQALWEEAHNAEKIKDFPLRADRYLRLAELGDKRAQYAYAECLVKGVGVRENREEATLWYKAAARHMAPAAALRLAFCLKGKKDEWNEQSLFWLQVAAELEDAEAQLILANAYEKGEGVSPSHAHCLYWLTAAARSGEEDAIVSLAQMYAKGDGIEARPAVSRGLIASLPKTPVRLLLLAARLGKGEREELPDVVLANREGERLAVAFKAESLGEHLIAAKLYFMSAMAGNVKAQYHLGLCYESGNGVPQSAEEARRRFGIAAKGGVTEAALALGRYAAKGIGGAKDDALALRMYTAAAEDGNAEAAYLLARAYADGTLTETNLPAALKWYEQAAAAGHVEANTAATRLREATASIYEKGRAAEQRGNYEAAKELYSAATDMGHTTAAYLLGLLCESGKLGRIERKEAFLAYHAASAGGNANAIYRLGLCYSRGFGVNRDFSAAARLFAVAAKQGVFEAATEANRIKSRKYAKVGRRFYAISSVMYRKGDVLEAIKFRNIAAKLGNARAMYLLGCHFDFGDGLPMDKSKAGAWYARAAKAGYIPGGTKDLKSGYLRERKLLLSRRGK